MNHLEWCRGMLEDKECQKLMEDKVASLIEIFFKGKDDYKIEKFVKSFCEGLMYLQNSLLLKRGLHHSQTQKNMMYLATHKDETAQNLKEVHDILINEINRQYRHFTTFLG